MDAVIWEFRLQDRRPGTYLALGVGMAAAYVVWLMQLPPWVWALAAAYLTLVFIRLSVNRGTTFRMTATALDVSLGGKRRSIALGAVAGAATDPAAARVCRVTLKDGRVCHIPCGDPRRAQLLARLVTARIAPQPPA